ELLQLLAAREDGAALAHTSSWPEDEPRPLSLFQERLWLLQRLDPTSRAFLIAAHWATPAGASLQAVVEALARLQIRHDVLRMQFAEAQGAPVGRLCPPAAIRIEDLGGLDAGALDARIERYSASAVHKPIDLATEPAVQFAVQARPDGRVDVMMRAHHIALDAWSINLLAQQLAEELEAPRPNGERPPQYADFAVWQRSRLATPAAARDLEWWTETLREPPQLCIFPPDVPEGTAGTDDGAGGGHPFDWDADLSSGLQQFARRNGATVYMTLLAAIAALLRKHTGQGDIVIGSPMGIRERVEFENVIGPFVNLLALRFDVADDPPFLVAVQRARAAILEAHAHREAPFEAVLERVKPSRSVRHSPVFQMALVQHNAAPHREIAMRNGGAMHELTWFVREVEGRLRGGIEYRTDLFRPETVARIAAQLEVLLRDAIAHPQRPLSELRVVDEAARRELLDGFNPAPVQIDAAPFHRQFERQAAACPERIALSFADESLDYRTLNRRANQLAAHLRAAGAGPQTVVAVCLERSPEMLVALLAVQKSGATYLPLDPGFPAERLEYMLDDSGAMLALATAATASELTLPSHVRVIDPLRDGTQIAAQPTEDPVVAAAPADPAYLIYTSGSTGRPKGVVVHHAALANFLGSMRMEPGLGADDVLASVTTISFDIAGLELYLPLLVGARILLIDRDTAADGPELAARLEKGRATVLQATPATWRMLIESDWRPSGPLRAFCGGEALPRDLADDLLTRVAELWNLYGPTETTIWSTVARVEASPAPITVGRPIANTRIYVLDAARALVPAGAPGEIWIGGDGVALGYHQRPELTAERFLPDPFAAQPDARMYRTGDMGRWDAAGRLQHMGRADHQVKIRGYRVELGEIEAALAGHEAVRQVVVGTRDAGPGDVRLVAYVVFAAGQELTASDVRRHLRRTLPDYMIPSAIVALESVPLTPNGKIDRKALPDPFRDSRRVSDEYVEPVPGPEQQLAAIWQEFLGVPRVGAVDNFFEIGGHSLLAVRVTSAVEKRLGWRLDPRMLFFQTLRQLAAAGGTAGDSRRKVSGS
ncbi:MAG: amino acid adenylation domain-containing protein, partial [Steroidobacteraceae bacterium]